MRRYLIAGNWKMNTSRESGVALAKAVAGGAGDHLEKLDVLVCPPFPYLIPVLDAIAGTGIAVGAQDCYFEQPGAFTGEVAASMLTDIGCTSVILGHSERRHVLCESDEMVSKKMQTALGTGLQVILCVGELLEEREAERTEEVLDRQMEGGLKEVTAEMMRQVVIAYEPVWAIGTGKTASPEQAESAHAHLRKWLEDRYNAGVANATRILYGGSVKANNAESLLMQSNVDGALVGGASLKPEEFIPIIAAGVAVSG